MSILIKGMKMPKNCEGCNFAEWENGTIYCHCIRYTTVMSEMEQLLSLCPLVEVPAPHGDLIDRNKLADEVAVLFERNQDILNISEEVEWLAETIEDIIAEYMPTVIESEE